jgi:thymidylate synthase ThyX
MLRRFASSGLSEINTLGRMIYDEISQVAPSIVIFHEANDRDLKTYPQLKTVTDTLLSSANLKESSPSESLVQLVEFNKDTDALIAAALLHTCSNITYEQCREVVGKLTHRQLKKVFDTAYKNMQFYDSMLREFEYANLTYNIVLSAACFGQMKRHRMSTITTQRYDPNLGATIPESIEEVGMKGKFLEIVDRTNETYGKLCKKQPLIAPYILTNAHRRRILMRLNPRELYHISRLREDTHAQWDIQNVSRQMSAEARRVMPLTFSLVGGKDQYNDLYQDVFGQLPKITKAALPGTRKISN